MISSSSFLFILWCNIAIIALWHGVTFVACLKLPDSTFDESRSRYAPRLWEHEGRWYRDNLKIQLWKDKIPQFISKHGFSKRHFTDNSKEYLDRFILETCRGEWMHFKNCICAIITLIINPFIIGALLSLFILIANVPFAIVQRYNRFRLQLIRKRRMQTAGMERDTVTA
ncbi:MAG TPA: hypothetical protein DG942_02640 [Ruminococcaceae bacterium]|jgi:glycosyl-4,4'-diaponeurosporenoate acyltransferase|nr:hypothetical protein [Oscillospiraceae bacterium]